MTNSQLREVYEALGISVTNLDPVAQLAHQAYGSHHIVDASFDHFENDDHIVHLDGRFNPLYEASHAF